MRKNLCCSLIGLICVLTLPAWSQNLLEDVERMLVQAPYKDQEILVKFAADDRSMEEITYLAKNLGLIQMEPVGKHGIYRLTVSRDLKQAILLLLNDPAVSFAEPNYLWRMCQESRQKPNDPRLGELWGMATIAAETAWDTRTDGTPTVVAVIDTGIDYNHQDIQANMWVNAKEKNGSEGVDDDGNGYVDDIHGWNGVANSGNPLDDHNHGTHCAGTIAGVGNNQIGVVGVCWSARVMACKFLNAEGSGTTEDAIKCIDYAVANGARVLSNSWGGGGFSEALYESIRKAGEAGVLFAAAAGNSYSNSLSFPAKYCEDNNFNGKLYPGLANVLSVAASDNADAKAIFSQYSQKANNAGNMIAAPGVDILSTIRDNGYDLYSGTSMATPHVAGAATLTWSQFPQLSAVEIKKRLVQSGDTLEWDLFWETMTVQRLNIAKALQSNK